MTRLSTVLPSLGLALAAAAAAALPLTGLSVAGESANNGIYDPSVEYAQIGGTGWLAYSAVSGPQFPFGPNVETHLARTDDAGASWTFVQEINPSSAPTSVTRANGQTLQGQWNYEVPSLVHDPSDASAPWKLFYHRIFRELLPNGTSRQVPGASWIGYRTAIDPSQGWSPEIVLLQGSIPLPDGQTAQLNVSGLDPSLGHLLLYSEPGAFARAGTLYLSLTGLVPSGSDRILMLASDDHAASWQLVSTVLSATDASLLGFTDFDGSSIVAQDGRTFLLASPGSPGLQRNGTLVFEFADLASGTLIRDANGAPVVLAHMLPDSGYDNDVGGGQADYHQGNTRGGLLVNQLVWAELPEIFQIRQSAAGGLPIPEAGSHALGAVALAWLIRRSRPVG